MVLEMEVEEEGEEEDRAIDVRELEHIVQRTVTMTRGPVISERVLRYKMSKLKLKNTKSEQL